MDELYDQEGAKPVHPIAAVFGAAMSEWRRSSRIAGADMVRGGVRDRVDRAMTVTVGREMERMERWMIFLASVGRYSPVRRAVRNRLGYHALLLGAIAAGQEHQPVRGGARHRGGAVRYRDRPGGGDPRRAGLQQAVSTDLQPAWPPVMEGFGTEFGAILSRQSEERA